MKRKLFIMIVAVLIICLTAGILLTACKPKDPPDEDDPSDDGGGGGGVMSTTQALGNVIEFVYDNTYADVKFDGSVPIVIDVELDVVLGSETYTLVAKGNLDVRPEVTSKAEASAVQDNSELYIALKKDAKTLIGIGYDVEGAGVGNLKPYLYLVSTDDNGANAVVKKVYGLSISKMMYDNANIEYVDDTFAADGAALASAEDGGIIGIIKALPKVISSILFGSTCQVNSFGDGGIQYVFNFDLKNTVTSLAGGGLLSILELIDSDEINNYIGPVVDGLKQLLPPELAEQVTGTGTTGLQQLLAVFANMLGENKENNVTGKFTFNFNKGNTFNSASIAIDASKLVKYINDQAAAKDEQGTDFNGMITINFDKLVLSNTATVDTFAGTPLEGQITPGDANVTNILDFALEATATGADDTYKISVNFDANPFAFVDMMKYSAKQDTNKDGVINADDEDTKVGQAFWQGKLVECLKNMGTANIVITKEGYTESTFDASRANGSISPEKAKSVIVYANFNPSNEEKAVDLFIWDESKGAEVSFGNGLNFPMDLNTFADKMIKDATNDGYTEKATTSAVNIGEIFGYVETFMPYLEPLFASFGVNADDMSFTIQYASLIKNVVMPVITALGDIESLKLDTSWLEANLQPLLAAIFGSVPEGGEALVPADKVVFTLESFEYAGTAIYPKAA